MERRANRGGSIRAQRAHARRERVGGDEGRRGGEERGRRRERRESNLRVSVLTVGRMAARMVLTRGERTSRGTPPGPATVRIAAQTAFLTSWNWSRAPTTTTATNSSTKGVIPTPDLRAAARASSTSISRISSEGSSTGWTPTTAASAGISDLSAGAASSRRATYSVTSVAHFSRTFSTGSFRPRRSVGNNAGASAWRSSSPGPPRSRRRSGACVRARDAMGETEGQRVGAGDASPVAGRERRPKRHPRPRRWAGKTRGRTSCSGRRTRAGAWTCPHP